MTDKSLYYVIRSLCVIHAIAITIWSIGSLVLAMISGVWLIFGVGLAGSLLHYGLWVFARESLMCTHKERSQKR